MTYDQILTLDSVVKYGSFKAAAEVLYKTQPTLSVAIKKLEEEFNIKIFDRSEYRPRLTPQGRIFYQKSLEVLESFQSLETAGRELGAGYETEIRVCAEAIFPIDTISNVLQRFFEPHITTTLNLNIDVLDGVMAKLQDETVDFALGPDLQNSDSLDKIKIMEVTILPVIAPQHTGIKLARLKKLPQIVVQSSVNDKTGKVHGGLSNQFWYTSDLFMKEQLISSGLGWGRLPAHQVEDKIASGKLVPIEGIKGISEAKIPLYLLKKKNKIMGPNTKSLWNYLSENSLNLSS